MPCTMSFFFHLNHLYKTNDQANDITANDEMVTLSKKKQLLGVPPPSLSSIVAKCVKKLGFVTFGRVEICSLKFSRTLGVW